MFEDKNAELMKKLAGTIVPSERFASAGGDLTKLGPISSQFFPQKEMNVVPLSTEDLMLSMGGGEDVIRQRFREQMKAMYPNSPEMWDVEPPVKERTFGGGMFWPTPSEKAQSGGALSKSAESDARFTALGEAIARLQAVRAVKALVDAGKLNAAEVAEALAAA